MTLRVHLCVLGALLLLSACGKGERPAEKAPPPAAIADWRLMVTPSDLARLRDWREAFTRALDKAKASGNGDSIGREGALLMPDAALPGLNLSAGRYRCRVIKIGSKGKLMGDYVVYPPTPCTLTPENEVMGFAKSGGTQRRSGWCSRRTATE